MAGQRTLTIRFIGDSKNLARSVKDIVSGLDDTESAGKRVATAMKQLSRDAEASFRDSRDAADKLAAALGPEMVSKIEAGGRSVDGYITDLQRMGLTFDDIRTDVDELAASIRNVETTKANIDGLTGPLRNVDDGIRQVRDSADQSRSVLANMVGNSVQDLGALGGVAGTAGMALGQFAEYATEGNISLGGIAKVAGPLAAVTGIGLGVAAVIGKIRDRAEEARKETELWIDIAGRLDSEDAAGAAEKLEEQYRGTIGTLEDLGYTTEDFVRHMTGERDIVAELMPRYKELDDIQNQNMAGKAEMTQAQVDELNVLVKLIPNLEAAATATENGVVAYQTQDRVTRELTTALEGLAVGTDGVTTATGIFGTAAGGTEQFLGQMQGAIDRSKKRTEDFEEALRDADEALSELKGNVDQREAWRNMYDSLGDLMTLVDEGEASWGDLEAANDDLALAIAGVIEGMEGVPPEVKTRLYQELDKGNLDYVRGVVEDLKQGASVPVTLFVTNPNFLRGVSGLSGSAGAVDGRGTKPPPPPPVKVEGVGATGGIVTRPTVALIGEAGPEMLVPLDSLPGNMPLSALERLGGGTTVVNNYWTVQVPPTVDMGAVGKEIREALLAYERESGPLAFSNGW